MNYFNCELFYANILPLLVCVNKNIWKQAACLYSALQYIFLKIKITSKRFQYLCIIYDVEQSIVNLYLPQTIEKLLLYKPIIRPGFDVMVAFGVKKIENHIPNLFTHVDFHQNQTHALTQTQYCILQCLQ